MKKISLKLILLYTVANIFIAYISYVTIPFLLCYGPETYNSYFDTYFIGIPFRTQIMLITIIASLISTALILYLFRDFKHYDSIKKEYVKTHDPKLEKKLNKMVILCLKFSDYILYIIFALLFFLELFILFKTSFNATTLAFKLIFLLFSFITIIYTIANIIAKSFLQKIIEEFKIYKLPRKPSTIISLLNNYLVPLSIITLVLTFFSASPTFSDDKANVLESTYSIIFKSIEKSGINDIKILQDTINKMPVENDRDFYFILDSNYNVIYSKENLSEFFLKYAKELSSKYNNTVYDTYATNDRGLLYPIIVNDEQYYLGIHYSIYNGKMETYISFRMFFINVSLYIIITFYNYRYYRNIKIISNNLEEINKNKQLNKKIVITSNDDFGKLSNSINVIKKICEENLNNIHYANNQLIERERLASLGSLIGGVSHNLKAPILSIAGANETLNALIEELESSIEDEQVNQNDHHEIAKDMTIQTHKIKDYLNYMSETIATIKAQAVSIENNTQTSFTIGELIKQINVLIQYELETSSTNLLLSLNVDPETVIQGKSTVLTQAIINMISNSIQAYDKKQNTNIEFTIFRENKNIIFRIRDYAGGLPEVIQEKLFTDMVTTKGKDGTGLELFLAYKNIKSNFKGDIKFKSEQGVGTTFDIIIPIK